MIYLITALDAEARALCDHYRLKRNYVLPYTLYTGDGVLLLVTGMGKSNAAMAVSALLGWRIPQPEDILINIGICGAPYTYTLGEALIIHQIIDGNRRYYPDILYTHPLSESPLLCIDTPQSDEAHYPVDMESSGVFQAASRFFKLHQMGYLKIVSDHFTPDTVTKEGVIHLIRSHLSTLDTLCRNISAVYTVNSLFSNDERGEIEAFKTHFTKSQGDLFEDALCYARLKNPSHALQLTNMPIPDSKRERSALLEDLITILTA